MGYTAEMMRVHPFFSGLASATIDLFAEGAAAMDFADGSYLFQEGEPARRLYAIRHGQVAVEMNTPGDGPVVVDMLRDGDVAGWSWSVTPYRYLMDARAVTPVSAIAFDGAYLRYACRTSPPAGYALLSRMGTVMSRRVRSANMRLYSR